MLELFAAVNTSAPMGSASSGDVGGKKNNAEERQEDIDGVTLQDAMDDREDNRKAAEDEAPLVNGKKKVKTQDEMDADDANTHA